MSIPEISRHTSLASNTMKKYLRSHEIELKHAGHTRSSKLDPYVEKLTLWLGMEVTKSRKQRRNLKQLHTRRICAFLDWATLTRHANSKKVAVVNRRIGDVVFAPHRSRDPRRCKASVLKFVGQKVSAVVFETH